MKKKKMNEKEIREYCDYSLRNDGEGGFVVNAMHFLKMEEADAVVLYRNTHNKGRYVICESRKGFEGGRMFIRVVTSTMSDALRKKGWWNTFTISKFSVPCGIWLCRIDSYRVDSNGFVNMIVEPIAEFPEVKFHFAFEENNGTWNSPAIHFMFGGKNFMPEYRFPQIRKSNFAEFRKRFPQYAELTGDALRDAVLRDWLRGDVELKELEDALNTKTDWENLVRRVQTAVAYGVTKGEFPEHPNFAEKVARPENSALWGRTSSRLIGYKEVEDYLRRNIESYRDLVRDGKMEPIDSDEPLDQIEAVLVYRKEQKRLEKLAKKAARKKKAAGNGGEAV